MKKARDVSYGQKTLGSLILKAQKSFIHEKWQGRESKIRTISNGKISCTSKRGMITSSKRNRSREGNYAVDGKGEKVKQEVIWEEIVEEWQEREDKITLGRRYKNWIKYD